MLKELIRFEGLFYYRKWSFYALLILFLVLGFLVGTAGNFSFPNTFKNSPYILSFVIAIFSLMSIFSVTILAANSLFRERDAGFDSILFATPLLKYHYFLSRFFFVWGLSTLIFLLLILGLLIGHQMPWVTKSEFTDHHNWYYLQPFLVFVIPNTLLCAAISCSIAWLTNNKLLVYISGLLLYILYIVGSLFSNSPLMAGVSAPSAEAMSMAAKFDPFGISAFFEQTQHWSMLQRNTQLLEMSGNFLINRILVVAFSFTSIFCTYRTFHFTLHKAEGSKLKAESLKQAQVPYKTIPVKTTSDLYHYNTFCSFLKLDLLSIIKSLPFILVLIIWTFLLGMEMYTSIDGGVRLPDEYATSGLMVTIITETLPFFALLVVVFYSSEVVWRSKSAGMASLERSTPIKHPVVFVSKCLAVSVIIVILIAFSIIIGITLQVLLQYYYLEWGLYISLFYLLGLPLLLCTVAIISIQVLSGNKYAGLALAFVFILLSNSMIGTRLGITHPLLQFANSFSRKYSDMNGFGKYIGVFGWRMLYWTSVTVLTGLFASRFFDRTKTFTIGGLVRNWKSSSALVSIICFVIMLTSGFLIYSKTEIRTKEEANNQLQQYEQIYRKYAGIDQPIITDIRTSIDLFPDDDRYEVKGEYTLVNKTGKAIDTLLLYQDNSIRTSVLHLPSSILLKKDPVHGHSIYKLSKKLQPLDSMKMTFSFRYSWSAFSKHDPANNIIENGSFMRISRYYPVFGYQPANEIDNETEREKRKMPGASPVKKLESTDFQAYNFINLEATISTSSDQTAIGIGELTGSWKKNNRNYFRYKTSSRVPFRFAVASAQYAALKTKYHGITLEVFYHPSHPENIQYLAEKLKDALNYCEINFGKYPFNTIRIAEISRFTDGFAATAYPASIFMNERIGIHANLKNEKQTDILNEFASHELSHIWWGNSQISPDEREGSGVLTETLAMYTELMLHKNSHDLESTLEKVRIHKDLYFGQRAYSIETGLFKSPGNAAHLLYDKGLVVMYQLYRLIGELKINMALRSLLQKHAYPAKAATTLDLLNELYSFSDEKFHDQIDDLFKRMVIHDLKINTVVCKKVSNSNYQLQLEASVFKYSEDGNGYQTKVSFADSVEAVVYFADGSSLNFRLPVVHHKISTDLYLSRKPIRIKLDPYLKLMEADTNDNVKDLN